MEMIADFSGRKCKKTIYPVLNYLGDTTARLRYNRHTSSERLE
jgi:hypothetical protein